MFHITLILFLQMCNLMKYFYNQILISLVQSIVAVIFFHLLMEKGYLRSWLLRIVEVKAIVCICTKYILLGCFEGKKWILQRYILWVYVSFSPVLFFRTVKWKFKKNKKIRKKERMKKAQNNFEMCLKINKLENYNESRLSADYCMFLVWV